MTMTVEVDESGISSPSYDEVLAEIQDLFLSIYGSDTVLTADTADGQFLAVIASAINDCNQAAVAVYNSFPPSFAQGVGLSNMVKINGIRRRVATHSTVDVTLTGQAGTQVASGKVQDDAGNLWALPALVTIGGGGTVTVTATADDEGAIVAATGEVSTIATPTRGWQSVTNADPATAGAPVETDAELRRRQAVSVTLPALSILGALAAAISNVDGVTRSRVYENDTGSADGDGIPAHSISAVVEGGDAQDIGEALALRKGPGIQTYGDVPVTVLDSRGESIEVNFFNLTDVPITVEITVNALAGWVSSTQDKIKATIALFLDELEIGEDSYLGRLFTTAGLGSEVAERATGLTRQQLDALSDTYSVTIIEQARDADPPAAADVTIDFDEAGSGDVADITITVT